MVSPGRSATSSAAGSARWRVRRRGLEALIAKWGADRLPIWQGGELRQAPALDSATSAALSAVGGWRVFALAEGREAHFARRNFIAAYRGGGAPARADTDRIGAGDEFALAIIAKARTLQ